MTSFPVSNQSRILEIAAVIVTAAGKFIFMDYLNWRFPFVLVAIVSWTAYIIFRHKTKPGILTYWGFRTDNFKTVLRKVLPYGLFSVAIFFAIGIYKGTIHLTWHIIPILILYPAWGIIQQFLLIAITVGNIQDLKGKKPGKIIVLFFAAILFAAVHYPFLWLMIATFILAIFYGLVYWRERNIYVLGLFHGWLGGIFYYTVLERDPFQEMFGQLLTIL